VNNWVDVLTNGEVTYQAMLEALAQATHHIHFEFFIIRNDTIGNVFKELLIRKAKEGVKVRIIYDSVGCWKLGREFIHQLKTAGCEVVPFFPVVFPVLSRELNYRNHRKIIVVDGRVGFVGGLSIWVRTNT
jgi:cardiolipin synthase